MIVIVIMSWIRFFSYFLIIKSISKLLMTLVRMIQDTVSFMFIVCCFLLISSSIFTTLFQGAAPEMYGSMTLSLRTLFDAMLGNYNQIEVKAFELSHSVLLICHLLVANIFLLNYLIAILSTVYELMMEKGDFAYKTNRYQYIEKYSIAMRDKWGYEELVIYPPPLNYLTIFVLPFIIKK